MPISEQFPIFANNPGLVYLDNAATTQKPQAVIDIMSDFYSKLYSNVHRGLYPLSESATELYELARAKVAKFINAEPEEIVFTANTTDSLNMIGAMLAKAGLIKPGAHILATDLEHHSNILPWREIPDAKLDFIPLNQNLELDLTAEDSLGKFDILATTYVSNVTGTIVPVKDVIARLSQTYSVVDAAQAVAHMPIDVKDLNCDFLAFSGHKLYGPTGIGVLYVKKELLEKLEPAKVGGGMIREVTRESATWSDSPSKFEAGTPPIAEAVGLAAAIDFVRELGWDKIQQHEQKLTTYLAESLKSVHGLKTYHPHDVENHAGVFAFTVDGVHPHDLSQALGEQKICVRAGHHCTQILHRDVLQIPASTRASIAVYNTEEDIDKLIAGIKAVASVYAK